MRRSGPISQRRPDLPRTISHEKAQEGMWELEGVEG